jgi:predicted esterase YcpF (UPF0227 family)
MSATIVFLHGFGTNGAADGYRDVLASEFPWAAVAAPDLPPDPLEAVAVAEGAIRRAQDPVALVGISLGGFYARHLAAAHGLSSVLVNPALEAHVHASGLVGRHVNFATGEPFEFTPAHFLSLSRLAVGAGTPVDALDVAVSMDDDVVPPDETISYCRRHGIRVSTFDGHGHRFLDFGAVAPLVRENLARAGLAEGAPSPR